MLDPESQAHHFNNNRGFPKFFYYVPQKLNGFCFGWKTKQERMETSNDCSKPWSRPHEIHYDPSHIIHTTNNLGILVKYLLTPEPAQGLSGRQQLKRKQRIGCMLYGYQAYPKQILKDVQYI